MEKSFFRSLVWAAFFSAILAANAQAQDRANSALGKNQDPSEAIVFLNQEAPDNQCDAFCICLAKSPAGFETSGSLLFLQPLSGNLVYATLINPFPFITPNWRDQAVDPGFTPAFNVAMRYDFGCGGDVQLSWTHLNSYDEASAQGNPTPVVVPQAGTFFLQALGPPFLNGPPPPFTHASAVAHFAYDAVNLDGGLLVKAGNHVRMRFFAGLEGARISHRGSTDFQSPDGSIRFNNTSESVFTGAGPRLGMDMHYCAGHLDFLCGLAGAALIGGMQSRIDFLTISPSVTQNGLPVNSQFLTSPDATRVVPSIDARLGASYAIPVGRFGIFKCEAGYQAAAYIDAVNQYSLSEVENPATFNFETDQFGGVFLRTAVELQTNFLVHGPYLRFSLKF